VNLGKEGFFCFLALFNVKKASEPSWWSSDALGLKKGGAGFCVLDWVRWIGCVGLGALDWVRWIGCVGLGALDWVRWIGSISV
jgi:hypothetical protein